MTNMNKATESFTAASALDCSRKAKALLTAQPGYRRGAEKCVMIAKAGGVRLYTRVEGKWVDSSLAAIKGLGIDANGGLYTY